MKVAYIIGAFFPEATGATHSAYRLAQSLRHKGVSITFITNTNKERSIYEYYDCFPVIRLWLHQRGKWKKLKAFWELAIIARKFDIIHIHGGGHMHLLLSHWLRIITRKPVIFKITSDGWDTPDGVAAYPWGWLCKHFYMRLTAIVAMTSGQIEKCLQCGYKNKVSVIPNGVDIARFCPVETSKKNEIRAKVGLPLKAIILSYLGWFGYGKGTDVLLRVFKAISMKYPNVHLLMVGDYMMGKHSGGDLMTFANLQEIENIPWSAITTIGNVQDAETYLQASDIFMFPSRREGFGTVQIEAMACGLPCLVNNLPGVSGDIYHDDSVGYVINNNDEQQFYDKICDLVESQGLRRKIGVAARKRVEENFSIESVAERYMKFYTDLLAGRN